MLPGSSVITASSKKCIIWSAERCSENQPRSRQADLSEVLVARTWARWLPEVLAQVLQHQRKATSFSLPSLSTTFLLLHMFFRDPCFPSTHQHTSHAFPLYSISICNSKHFAKGNKLAASSAQGHPEELCRVQDLKQEFSKPWTKDGMCCTLQSPIREHAALEISKLLQGAWHYSKSSKNNENYFLSIWGTCKLPFTVISECQTLSDILTGFEGFQDEVVLMQACLTTVL